MAFKDSDKKTDNDLQNHVLSPFHMLDRHGLESMGEADSRLLNHPFIQENLARNRDLVKRRYYE